MQVRVCLVFRDHFGGCRDLSGMRWFVLVLFAACASSVDPPAPSNDVGELDCVGSVDSDDARGLLAYANDIEVGAPELIGVGLEDSSAASLVAARPFATLAELDAVPRIGGHACRVLRAQACDVRGLCEAVLPVWTWNVKTFPLSGEAIGHVAAMVAGAEIVGFQEVDSLAAFDELLHGLPGWVGVAGEYGFGTQVAIAFRADRLKLVASEDLWDNDPDRFPRPVLALTFEITGRAGSARFTVVDVHLKAQIDADSQRRRREAIVVLEAWLAERRAAGELVIALGDWNDDIDDAPEWNVFAPILAKPDAYVALTAEVAERGDYSYIPFKRLIDHIVLTREAAEQLQVTDVGPLPLETAIPRYTYTVSDHRPVRAALIPVLPSGE